jgi:hypothetical protein
MVLLSCLISPCVRIIMKLLDSSQARRAHKGLLTGNRRVPEKESDKGFEV